jgi:hypothetical protein
MCENAHDDAALRLAAASRSLASVSRFGDACGVDGRRGRRLLSDCSAAAACSFVTTPKAVPLRSMRALPATMDFR